VVRRAPGGCGVGATEAQREKIEFLDEGINDAHRVVLADIVVKAFGQQGDLLARLALDESLHGHLAQNGCTNFNFGRAELAVFSHSLGQNQTFGAEAEFEPEVDTK
jgi:hypothetical protein